ncbi:MAG: hypothetical protein C5B55_08040 [Blastocatellia bacterium]|nr:MAG: hypothetical protein C5B55_08040 [Blastocatellia bacterium]
MPPPDDELTTPATKWLDRAIIGCVFLIALSAPVSIAASQSAWLLGMVLWLARFAFYPRPRLSRTPVDYALLGFFLLSGLSSFLSYQPVLSIGKMRAASLFTVAYLIAENVRSLRLVRILALTLVVSAVVTVLLTVGQLALGKGVKLEGVKKESPLSLAVFHTRTVRQPTPILSGDIVWEVDNQRIHNADELAAALAAAPNSQKAEVKIYRVEWMPTLEVPRGRLLSGADANEQLGITGWKRGRDWRATGFFGHWVTYAEVIQLIASLTLGLLLALPKKQTLTGALLFVALIGLVFALAMTVTRASWAGFAVSAALMLLLSASRRTQVIAAALAIVLVIGGVVLLQQRRAIGFFDRNDQSTSWRETVWREGFDLLVSKPRHLVVGVGMDSIKGHWREWGLFDHGRLPMGHMHSDMLQIALERGVPALIAWLVLLVVWARMLWRIVRRATGTDGESITNSISTDRGIALGSLGGLTGFFTSGLVHYNWGDSEVVMVLYLFMGLTLVINQLMSDEL